MSKKLTNIVADIVRDAGGQVVGRTKLQKLTYVLVASGLEDKLQFLYKHYGPYSEAIASASREANLLGMIKEKEEQTTWGGSYSVYTSVAQRPDTVSAARVELCQIATAADAVELELAATALFLTKEEGRTDAWSETERRKPDKASNGRLDKAKALYQKLAAIDTPVRLPVLN
jgi:uncharacterized protein